MQAKCLDLRYEEGIYSYSQGVKGGGIPGRRTFKDGFISTEQGNGYKTDYKPSRLILTVQINNYAVDVWIERFFKDQGIRITHNRVDKLKAAMPEFINVSQNGNYYYADDNDLENWKASAGF